MFFRSFITFFYNNHLDIGWRKYCNSFATHLIRKCTKLILDLSPQSCYAPYENIQKTSLFSFVHSKVCISSANCTCNALPAEGVMFIIFRLFVKRFLGMSVYEKMQDFVTGYAC